MLVCVHIQSVAAMGARFGELLSFECVLQVICRIVSQTSQSGHE